jgi:hypothetical protein
MTDGIAKIEALRDIFMVNERALFEWVVSRGSMEEGSARSCLTPGRFSHGLQRTHEKSNAITIGPNAQVLNAAHDRGTSSSRRLPPSFPFEHFQLYSFGSCP